MDRSTMLEACPLFCAIAGLVASSLLYASGPASAAEREKPLAHLAGKAYTLYTAEGDASIPMEVSVDLDAVHAEITRAAIVFHGKGRNVEGYYAALERAAHDAGQGSDKTLLWAPQCGPLALPPYVGVDCAE